MYSILNTHNWSLYDEPRWTFTFDVTAAVQSARIGVSPPATQRRPPTHTRKRSRTVQNHCQCSAVAARPQRHPFVQKVRGGWVTHSVVKRTPNCLVGRERHSQQPILEFVQSPPTHWRRQSQSSLPAALSRKKRPDAILGSGRTVTDRVGTANQIAIEILKSD